MQKIIDSLSEKTPKQLRTLRNNLNNRIESFKTANARRNEAKELKDSHMLCGLTHKECEELLVLVKKELNDRV